MVAIIIEKKLVTGILIALTGCLGGINLLAGEARGITLPNNGELVTQIIMAVVYWAAYTLIFSVRYYKGIVPTAQITWMLWGIQDSEKISELPLKPTTGSGHKMNQIRCRFESFKRWVYYWPGAYYLLFAAILDLLADGLLFRAQGHLPAVVMGVLRQSMVAFTFMWSVILLRRQFILQEVSGVLIVLAVSVVLAVDRGNRSTVKDESGIQGIGSQAWSDTACVFLSMMLEALSYIMKEWIFDKYKNSIYKERNSRISIIDKSQKPPPLESRNDSIESDEKVSRKEAESEHESLDLFLMTTVNSVWYLIFSVPLMILTGYLIPGKQEGLGVYFSDAFSGLYNDNAPEAFTVYAIINVMYNICTYLLLFRASALLAFMSQKIGIPVAFLLSLHEWPILTKTKIETVHVVTLIMVLIGIIVYRLANDRNEALVKRRESGDLVRICMWPLFHPR